MQLKKSVFMALALVAMGVASCDQISDGDRYLAVDDPISPGDSTGSDTTDINAPIYHSVLVEEFSGQLCVNCPAASDGVQKTVSGGRTLLGRAGKKRIWLSLLSGGTRIVGTGKGKLLGNCE